MPENGRVGAALAEHVGLPVVELELSRGADLLDRLVGVVDVGQADRDLVAPGALDLRLGDAQGVGALPDRLDRVVDRLRRDLGHLRRGPALVDELDAALEVEAEAGGLLAITHTRRPTESEQRSR